MSPYEAIGFIASALIVFSMVFKTTSFKGTVLMRIINGIGSVFFVAYGALIGAWSTLIANCCIFVINIIYLIIEIKSHKNTSKQENGQK